MNILPLFLHLKNALPHSTHTHTPTNERPRHIITTFPGFCLTKSEQAYKYPQQKPTGYKTAIFFCISHLPAKSLAHISIGKNKNVYNKDCMKKTYINNILEDLNLPISSPSIHKNK